MKEKIKNILRKIPFKKKQLVAKLFRTIGRKNESKISKIFTLFIFAIKCKVYPNDDLGIDNLFKQAKINFSKNDYFLSSIDIYKSILTKKRVMDNCSPNYSIFINSGIKNIKFNNKEQSSYFKSMNSLLLSINNYIERAVTIIKKSNNVRKDIIVDCLTNFIERPAINVEDALQRIILIDELFWQTGHTLIGVGRLDLLLNNFVSTDKHTDDELINMFCEFLKALHKYYDFKSAALMGDTGQLIILGGKNEDGSYFCNKFTFLIIKALKKCHLPDPKVLLRVSSNTPSELIKCTIDCISTGIGSPLFSNDDVVINSLIQFGYDSKDAYGYTTSACWEIIADLSYEQNNLRDINFLEPFNLIDIFDSLESLKTFEDFLNAYLKRLQDHTNWIASTLNEQTWERDPLLSLCCSNCNNAGKDISDKGGKYNNYGILSVGLANAVNAIMNVKKIVYIDKMFDYREFNNIRKKNFDKNEDLLKYLQEIEIPKFGEDNSEIINLTKMIVKTASDTLKTRINNLGETFKFGLSSPGYIMGSYGYPPSFDGRPMGTPFSTHISNDSCKSYTEIINFATSLDYGDNRFNGNVVDLMISPSLLSNNLDKMTALIQSSISKGIFQLQFNVVSSEILIKAKSDPKFMPNLIVRVWGFSAYFNDLPTEYKDLLIKRALENEHKGF